jgi:hypothetical protein
MFLRMIGMFANAIRTDVPEIPEEEEELRQEPIHETPPPLTQDTARESSIEEEQEQSIHQTSPSSPEVSTSKVISPEPGPSQVILPETIYPYPKTSSRNKKTSKNRGKAAILTSTPYKDELNASLKRKQKRESKNECQQKMKRKITVGKKHKPSKSREGWIRCSLCEKWVHNACAGIASDDEDFTCDKCRYVLASLNLYLRCYFNVMYPIPF